MTTGIQLAVLSGIEDILAGYDAKFPDSRYQQGARQFPLLIPTSADDPAAAANRGAWQVLRGWDKPFLTIFSDSEETD